MDIELILGGLVAFFVSPIGVKVLVWLWSKLGVIVDNTKTELDDSFYDASPDFLEAVVKYFDLGTADEILKKFLKVLEETDEDTTELEKEIKNKEDEIKKQS